MKKKESAIQLEKILPQSRVWRCVLAGIITIWLIGRLAHFLPAFLALIAFGLGWWAGRGRG